MEDNLKIIALSFQAISLIIISVLIFLNVNKTEKDIKPESRYFMFSASYELENKNVTMNYGTTRFNGFPKGKDLKYAVTSNDKNAAKIVILSVCELSKEDYETFFNDL